MENDGTNNTSAAVRFDDSQSVTPRAEGKIGHSKYHAYVAYP